MNEIGMSLDLKFFSALKNTSLLIKKDKTIDADTFQEMIYPLKNNLYNFIFKALNFSEETNDIFQETVLRAFKYINSFSKKNSNLENSFKTWIFSIAHNEIKHYFKKNRNPVEKIEINSNINCKTDLRESVQDIYDIAKKLKPKHRTVFFLFYYNRFSIYEISKITGLKEGNIKYILNKSREEIKEKLGVKDEQKNR